MFETSKDILNLVISFCVIWITIFLCWMFYYAAKILKNTSQIVEEFRMRLQLLTDAINYVKHKVEQISAALGVVGSGVAGYVKKVVAKKAEDWVDGSTEKAGETAKEAVDRAVEATAKGMRRVTDELR